MPYQEKQIEKKYFTIGEVAQQLGVATSLLRFWEQEFPDYIKPGRYHKAGRKNRKYTLSDIDDVKKIYYLVKVRGFTLDGARKELTRQEIMNCNCQCPQEIKTGQTSAMCCNICGKPDDPAWVVEKDAGAMRKLSMTKLYYFELR